GGDADDKLGSELLQMLDDGHRAGGIPATPCPRIEAHQSPGGRLQSSSPEDAVCRLGGSEPSDVTSSGAVSGSAVSSWPSSSRLDSKEYRTSSVALRTSRRDLPIDFPTSGSRLGPTIRSATRRMTMSSMGPTLNMTHTRAPLARDLGFYRSGVGSEGNLASGPAGDGELGLPEALGTLLGAFRALAQILEDGRHLSLKLREGSGQAPQLADQTEDEGRHDQERGQPDDQPDHARDGHVGRILGALAGLPTLRRSVP